MKKAIALLLLLASTWALAAPDELRIVQRDSTDTITYTRQIAPPNYTTQNSLLLFDYASGLPVLANFANMSWDGTTLTATGTQADWLAGSGPAQILNRPILATVATSGAYSDLSGTPSLAAVAISGAYTDLAGRPTLAAVATSGAYTDLSGRPSLATVATSGSYTDLSNKPTIPTVPTAAQSSATRSLNSAFQVSASRGAFVFYSAQMTLTASITSGMAGSCVLEIASDSGFTTSVQTLATSNGSQTYTLAIALQGVTISPCSLSGYVPPGYYARLRTVNTTGTPTFAYLAGQEILF